MSEEQKNKPSGSFYRKRKAKKAAEAKLQAKALKMFLKTPSQSQYSQSQLQLSNLSEEAELEHFMSQEEGQQEKEVEIEMGEISERGVDITDKALPQVREEDLDVNSEVVLSDDPGNWPVHISNGERQILVKRGPVQITNMQFPINEDGRRFTANNYIRRLCNGEDVLRVWLIYSITKNSIFCFCCRLFSTVRMSLSSSTGFSDWKHMSELLSEHERSSNHMRACQSWSELHQRLHLGKTIDAENQRIIENEAQRWTEVFKRLITIIQYLASQNIALCGNTDKLYARDNGNFLKLLEFIGKFDIVIADHLRRITTKEVYVHYLGKDIQNEIISLLGSKIRQNIVSDILKSMYYSIMLDCTPDVSHVEQMTLIIRFVQVKPGQEISINECFLGFIPVNTLTGEGLTDILLQGLRKLNVPLCNMRGQGYDNGPNMRGKHSGVQKRILDLNSRAFFVPCSTHSLNLVLNDAALSCVEAVSFFGIIQEIYNYFAGSVHRWAILKNNVSNLTLKPLSQTRWESRINAVTPFRYQIGEIYDALYEASNDNKIDAFGKNTAKNLAKKIKSYKFICCTITWYHILYRMNLVSKVLQEKAIDIQTATDLISNCKKYFNELRSDKGFEEILVDARDLADTLDIEPGFEQSTEIRPRKIKRQFNYESGDDPVVEPKQAYKINFFLDKAINSLEERFEQLQKHNDIFSFLYDVNSEKNSEDLLKKCKDFKLSLTDGNHRDVDGLQLHQELTILSSLVPSGSSPTSVLNFISKNCLIENFPNTVVALRILLTLPITVASGERSFSKLKLIKNYLRSSISQDRLVGLAMMSIE